MITQNEGYKNWLIELKSKIQQSQIKAALAVNSQLIMLYWELGSQIVEKQETAKWGSGFIDQLSKDLKSEFPDMKGFSSDNLRYTKLFYTFYQDHTIPEQVVRELYKSNSQLVIDNEQAVLQMNRNIFNIPWGHHIVILQKIKNQTEALFYVQKTIENNWSRLKKSKTN